jgi:hypothetical protein
VAITAKAARQLNAQAITLLESVDHLVRLVGTSGSRTDKS